MPFDPLLLFAESYLHSLDPFAFRFTESFGIRWYGLSYAAGFLIGWWIIRAMARTGRSRVPAEAAGDLIFYLVAGVLVGGRLGYALFYDPALFIGFSAAFPYWDLLAINRGGMASHGGIVGTIVAVVLFARRHAVPALHVLDVAALACTPGLFLGRLANFVNGELWGVPLAAARQADPPWWSVKYPEEILDPAFPHREAIADALSGSIGGDRTFLDAVVAAARAGDEHVRAVIEPLLTAHYPSALFQAITDGPLLAAALVLVWLRPRKPGVVGASFLVVYGILRLITEEFREPDAGVAMFLGLSRGQTLSAMMIAAGTAAIVVCSRRTVPRLGGMLKREEA